MEQFVNFIESQILSDKPYKSLATFRQQFFKTKSRNYKKSTLLDNIHAFVLVLNKHPQRGALVHALRPTITNIIQHELTEKYISVWMFTSLAVKQPHDSTTLTLYDKVVLDYNALCVWRPKIDVIVYRPVGVGIPREMYVYVMDFYKFVITSCGTSQCYGYERCDSLELCVV